MRYGFMFITVGMVLLIYEEEETRKVMLHHGGDWLVRRCYTWLVSFLSLLFSSTIMCFIVSASCFACFARLLL